MCTVWLNIEGQHDFRYKTPINFSYSKNNSGLLNRPPNINLIVVDWMSTSKTHFNFELYFRQLLCNTSFIVFQLLLASWVQPVYDRKILQTFTVQRFRVLTQIEGYGYSIKGKLLL